MGSFHGSRVYNGILLSTGLSRALRQSREVCLCFRYLRRVILSIACDVGLEKAVTYAKSMFKNWMEFDNRYDGPCISRVGAFLHTVLYFSLIRD